MKPTDTPWTVLVITLCFLGMLGLLACMSCGRALWWAIHPVVAFVINAVFLAVALVAILIFIPMRQICRHYGWDIDRECKLERLGV